MDWITTANGLIALISGLAGLVASAVSVFFMVRAFIKNFKEKSREQQWATLVAIADAAMQEAEHSAKTGADKKKMVINTVKAGAKAAGINADDFIDQLSAYIDSAINWFNNM